MMVSTQSSQYMSRTNSLDKFSGKVKLIYLKADDDDVTPMSSARSRRHPTRHRETEDRLTRDMRHVTLGGDNQSETWAQRTGFNPSARSNANTSRSQRVNKSKSVNDLRSGSNSRLNSSESPPSNGHLEKWSHRSTSNRLLNCFTIDDCRARYREKLAVGKQPIEQLRPASRKAKSLEHFTNGQDDCNSHRTPAGRDYLYEGDSPQRGNHRSPSVGSVSKRQSESRMRDSSNMSLYMGERMSYPADQQDALGKAMYTLLTTTEVVNNTTHGGLFRKAKPRPELVHQESKRFRRLNETLRRWIEEEYIRPRTCPGNMSNYRSSPTLKATIQVRPKSNQERRGAPEDLLSDNGHTHDKDSDGSYGKVQGSSMSSNHRSDSLLQMLMGMEQEGKKAGEAWRSLSADSAFNERKEDGDKT